LGQVGATSAALTAAPLLFGGDGTESTSSAKTDESGLLLDPQPSATIEYINPSPATFKDPEYPGEYYEAVVPATLDLAERARLAVHSMTCANNPHFDYEMYFAASHVTRPPSMGHTQSDLDTWGKWVESTALMRIASGSTENLNVDRTWMEMLLKMQGPDGLLYSPMTGRDWVMYAKTTVEGSASASENPTKQFCLLSYGTPRALAAMCLFAQMDPNGPWKEAAHRLAHAYDRLMINTGDNESHLFSPWMYPGRPVKNPEHNIFDKSFYAAASQAWIAQYLAMYDRALHDPPSTKLAERIMNYNMFDRQVNDSSGRFQIDPRLGEGKGAHIHTHAMNIMACLYVYMQTGNKAMLDRAVKSYEFVRTKGEPLVGFYPDFAAPAGVRLDNNSETDNMATVTLSALTLARLAYDNCWDDADRWVRNQLAEAQLTQIAWLSDGHLDGMLTKKPSDFFKPERSTTDRVAERTLGGFGGCPSPNDWVGDEKRVTIQGCCTASGARVLFAAWRDMLKYDQGTLKVNLLFNRASKWADIDSYIPYIGRVELKIKEPLSLEVRIPEWVKAGEAKCEVDSDARVIGYEGRYAQIGKVGRGQTVVVTFPISERTEKRRIEGYDYTFIVRGNDVVAADPSGKYCPFYQRGHYRTGTPLYEKVRRFVSAQEVPWW
jgi:hypothetical protein